MTISQILWIVTLFGGILLHFVQPFGVPSSIAIVPFSDGEIIICAIVFKNNTKRIECCRLSAHGVGEAFPVYPAISFASISGGREFLCGLQYDGTTFFCWKQTSDVDGPNGVDFVPIRVHESDTVPLRDLVVGESQVAASDRNGTFIQWWFSDRSFPARSPGNFRSLTSGAGFTCAIHDSDDSTKCWGPRGRNIQAVFAGQTMSTVVAGQFRACGVTKDGRVLCSGGAHFRQPSFGFQSLALGTSHTCVLRSSNRTVVCWGAGGDEYAPAKNLSFVVLVADGNIFCGVTTVQHSIHCWWTDRSASLIVELPLRTVVPGVCAKQSSCQCGHVLGTSKFCDNSDVICMSCTSQPPSSHSSSLSEPIIEWIVLACVGFALALICVWSRRGRNMEV